MLIFIKSVFIGMFAIFPGISGSALAISLNIYDRVLLSLKDINKNKKFLLCVVSGLIFGIIIGSKIIIYLSSFESILYCFFIGLIISDIPFMISKTRNNGKIRYVLLLSSFVVSTITFIFYTNIHNNNISFIKMFIGGIMFSFGKIFPGISSSFFLISLGIYRKILIMFSNPTVLIFDFYYWVFILGMGIGLIIFMKLLNYLLSNKFDFLYSTLIGFMISSIIPIFPKFGFNINSIIGIIVMLLSFMFSFKFKQKKEI